MKKIIKRIFLTVFGLLAFVAISISIVLHIVFTPEKVTPVVLKLANEHLKADVDCESVEITFFRTFPDLGILLKNGKIVPQPLNLTDSLAVPLQDTLVSFRSCLVSFNPVAFLTDREIIVHHLELIEPDIYAFVNAGGEANWNIFPAGETETDTVLINQEKIAFEIPRMNLNRLHISEARIIYDDRQQNVFAMADSLKLELKGNMSGDSAGLDMELDINALTTYYEEQELTKKLPVEIIAKLRTNRISKKLTIEKAMLAPGILKLDANGTLQWDSVTALTAVDVDFKLQASSLSDLLTMIPEHFSDIRNRIITTGKIDSYGNLKGNLGKDSYPALTLALQVQEGSLRSASNPEKTGIKNIEINCDARVDMSKQTTSYLNIKKIGIETASSKLECSGTFDDLLNKPLINTAIKANIDFNRMSQDFPFVTGMTMGGLIRADLNAHCYLDDMLAGNYGKVYANGNIDVDRVIFRYPDAGIDVFASLAKLRMGSNVTDSIRGRERESLFRGDIELDSLAFRWKDELIANTNKLAVRFRTTEPVDTNTIAVMSTSARFENLQLTTSDSIRMRAYKAGIALRLAPLAENKAKPELSARVTMDSLRGRMPGMAGRVNNARLSIKLRRQESAQNRQSRERRAVPDSAMRMRRIQSVRNLNRESDLSFQLESSDAKDVLQKWYFSGSFECRNASLRTPYFPLPVKMLESALNFTNNSLSLAKTHVTAGSSDMALTGEIQGIRQALLRNGKLTVQANMATDSVDFNELIRAFVAGSEFAEKNFTEQDSISQMVLDDTKELNMTDTVIPKILVIPRNVDIELTGDMKKVRYNNLAIDKASGKIAIRNQSVRLSDMQLNSDMGNANMSLVYKAPNTKGAHLGLDLQMSQVQVKELIAAFPLIDTLAPMLRSFEGVVDCNLSAMTELDSTVTMVLPSTTASCYLNGVNMVLLDGETFTEISKKLMFKNKKRNIIDNISIEMIMEDSKIMVFPFQLTMDRYTAGIGGTQNLDMSFDYHITVLKSPLPFKIGLNLSGTLEDMKYKIVKPKYKDLFTPAKERSLASEAPVNLRQQLQENLQKSISAIINEPLTAPVRRPRITMNDRTRKMYFDMDTVSYQPVPDSSLVINMGPAGNP